MSSEILRNNHLDVSGVFFIKNGKWLLYESKRYYP